MSEGGEGDRSEGGRVKKRLSDFAIQLVEALYLRARKKGEDIFNIEQETEKSESEANNEDETTEVGRGRVVVSEGTLPVSSRTDKIRFFTKQELNEALEGEGDGRDLNWIKTRFQEAI